ncbi:MAG TPA: hypothetical protein VH643_33715 [Gemmataceae bacterium]
MRFRSLLLPLAFAVLGLAAGCHHRHCCWRGCCSPCCSPCDSCCCGYPPSAGVVPPLAPSPVPIAAPLQTPQMPLVGAR